MYILCDIWLETVLQPDKLWIFYSNAAVPSIYNIGTDNLTCQILSNARLLARKATEQYFGFSLWLSALWFYEFVQQFHVCFRNQTNVVLRLCLEVLVWVIRGAFLGQETYDPIQDWFTKQFIRLGYHYNLSHLSLLSNAI